jgi:hypothetical protein
VLHEMGHILGIGTLWEDLGLLSGAGTSNPIFTGANATAQYNQIFGTSARGVPVEATGGAGTADSHWRETVLTNELMTGWAGPGTNLPLSRITIGSLADLGYTVNYAAADSFTPSSSSLAAARQASSLTSLTSSRLVGLVASAEDTSVNSASADLTTNSANIAPRRSQPLAALQAQSIDPNLADSAMADAWDQSHSAASRNKLAEVEAQNATDIDHVWTEVGQDWELSPAFSLA